jgi:oligopeptide transport system ATP-binding protein
MSESASQATAQAGLALDRPILDVRGLSKSFRVRRADGGSEELIAVDNVSFTVPGSGSLAVVGESGSGKTTIARMVAGLERPTAGSIYFDGAERPAQARGRAARKRRGREVQMVYQDPYSSLDPRQAVGACIGEVLRFHFSLSKEARQERILQLLNQVGLEERHAQLRPRSLSGGQRQRVAIARALACEPKLLILDEAVSALDVSVQGQVLNLLADLRGQVGAAYLFISHDLAVVQQVSDTTIVMHNGRLLEEGATDQILQNPRQPYTQLLLSAVPRPGWKPRRQIQSPS